MSAKLTYNITERKNIIIENALKMIMRRGNLSESSMKKLVPNLQEKSLSNDIFDFEDDNKKKWSLNIIQSKINSVNKGSPLEDYFLNNLDTKKVIIVNKPSKKLVKQIINNFKSEVFNEYEMLEDIPSKVIVPKHIPLNEKEKNMFLENYKYSEVSKMHSTETMARYFNMKVDDIVKIVRISPNSGESIAYRHIVQGNLDLIV